MFLFQYGLIIYTENVNYAAVSNVVSIPIWSDYLSVSFI